MTGERGTDLGGAPPHPECCTHRIAAPAKLATVARNITIVHQSVL